MILNPMVQSIPYIIFFATKENNSRTKIQRNGETNDCENKFSRTRQRNNKPSLLDCNETTARRIGVRAHAITKKHVIILAEIHIYG